MENSKKELEFKITGLNQSKKELRALNDQLTELKVAGKDGTKEYAELIEKAGQLKDAIGDVRTEINRASDDTRGFKDALDVVKGGVSVFQAIQSSVALFGVENEKVEETLEKLVATQNLLNSIDAIKSSYLNKASGLYKLLTKDIITYTGTSKAATVATKALNVALKSIGIGLIISLIATLVSKSDELLARFPALNSAISKIEPVVSGLGSAIMNFLVTPIETLLTVLSDLKNGEFKKALSDLRSGLEKQFTGTVEAFKEGYKQTKEIGKDSLEQQIKYLEALKDSKSDLNEQYKIQKQIFALKEKLINETIKDELEKTTELLKLDNERKKAAEDYEKAWDDIIKKRQAEQKDWEKDALNQAENKIKGSPSGPELGKANTTDLTNAQKRVQGELKDLNSEEEEANEKAKKAKEKAKEDAIQIAEATRDAISSVFEGMSSIIQENIDKIQDEVEDVTKDIERSERKVEKYQNKLQNYYSRLSDSVGEDRREVVSAIKETEMAIEEQYALQEQLDAEKQAKEKEMRAEEYKQKKINLANSLIQSIVNTAVGITQVIAQSGVAAPVLAAIIGAMGAVQTALIASQMGKLKMANGGLLKGASHGEGGIPVGNTGIEVEGGEYVVNKRATSKYLPILEQINSYGKSTTKFSRGGELNLPNSDSFETAELLLSNINFNPVVSVVDINKASNRLANVKVMSR